MTIQVANSADVAAATATATFTGISLQTWYIYGFIISWGGATGAVSVNATLSNLVGSASATLNISVSSGVGIGGFMAVTFPAPIPATIGSNVVLTLPSVGTGSAHAACALIGELR